MAASVTTPEAGPAALVAHRGHAAAFVENTRPAIESALECGAGYIEIDVQLSADGVPLLFHDRTLARLAGRRESIGELPWSVLRRLELHHPAWPQSEKILPLADLIPMIHSYPDVHWFVELKDASLNFYPAGKIVETVCTLIDEFNSKCSIISFSEPLLCVARSMGIASLGWILKDFSATELRRAFDFSPAWVFADINDIPSDLNRLAGGDWSWAIYEIQTSDDALRCFTLGARLVETFQICEMRKRLAATP